MSNNSTFPTAQKPLLVEKYEGNAIRIRLVEIEHKGQPGTRNKNAVHVELFDEINLGHLNRTVLDSIEVGDDDKYEFDQGIFLCGRNSKDIKIFHSESDVPTCKKCIDIANRLISKGLDIYTVNKKNWGILQEYYYNNLANKLTSNLTSEQIEELRNEFDDLNI